GNFDGKGSPNLSGTEASVPLLFDLFNAINYDSKNNWFKEPRNLYKRKVCSESGLLPTSLCTSLSEDYAIKNRSHNNKCNLHQEIYVNKNETIQYCTECLPQKNYHKKIYDVYEPDVSVWMLASGYNFPRPPLHSNNCQAKFTSGGPNILSPSENYEYLIEENSGQELMLLAASDSKIKTQYWFIDGKYFSKTSPGEKIFYSPINKNIKITCIDDNGRDNSINVVISYY
ncbi:MAG: hypothetical protein R3321_15650, partial [Nitrososphaeraceae archaeon]|nr:hypothetical protein [Nitrososphaeraceae archaeon]